MDATRRQRVLRRVGSPVQSAPNAYTDTAGRTYTNTAAQTYTRP